jgi:biotin carboxyl carrier protein
MKMEQNLTAIKDGIIDDILVTSGQGVNEGDILLHFRESEELD